MTIFGVNTRIYRIVLIAFNLATAVVGSITAWGPGIGLDLPTIGVITTIGNTVIVLCRQILDPSTPTIPGVPPGGN